MSFLDISKSTANTTAIKRGDYNAAESRVGVYNKSSGSSTSIKRGYACDRKNTVTPNVYGITTGKTAEPVVITGLPLAYIPTNVNVTNATDGNGEDICATDDDVAFTGIRRGRVAVKINGSAQPGQQLMTANNGEFAAYDGSGIQYVKGVLVGAPGAETDARIIKQAVNNAIGIIDFDGGA